jgi:hypothetical protein
MNEKEKILQEIIDEMEEFVEDGKQSRFNPGKVILDSEILMTMLEELRSQVPAEIERGQQIIQTKQNILDNAKIQADKIVEKALKEANETVEEHEIVKLAKRRANDIEQQANQYADDLVKKAKADAKEIRLGAMEYTRDIINSITEYFEVMKEEQVKVHNAHAKLLSEMDSEIEDLKSNSAQMENQIHALANAGMSRPRTIDDL